MITEIYNTLGFAPTNFIDNIFVLFQRMVRNVNSYIFSNAYTGFLQDQNIISSNWIHYQALPTAQLSINTGSSAYIQIIQGGFQSKLILGIYMDFGFWYTLSYKYIAQ